MVGGRITMRRSFHDRTCSPAYGPLRAGRVHNSHVHSSDWEGVELALSSTNAVEHLSLP
jgi:hypothetical protein